MGFHLPRGQELTNAVSVLTDLDILYVSLFLDEFIINNKRKSINLVG